jgi:hypothetical protein
MAEANPGRINVGSAGNGADTTMQQLWKFNVGVEKDNTEQEAGDDELAEWS